MSPLTICLAIALVVLSVSVSPGNSCNGGPKASPYSRLYGAKKREMINTISGDIQGNALLKKRSFSSSSEEQANDNSNGPQENTYRKFFDVLDGNNDGVITYDEGLSYYTALDKNQDGDIEEVEFERIRV